MRVVGCIHGDETAGIAVACALERISPPDLDLWILPDLNPDGVAAGTRRNAHGVDLNRNFPFDWQNHALPGTTAFAAKLPAGRPNAAAVDRYVQAVRAAAHTLKATARSRSRRSRPYEARGRRTNAPR